MKPRITSKSLNSSVLRSTITSQQRAAQNSRRRHQRHLREAQHRALYNTQAVNSSPPNGDSSVEAATQTNSSQELLQNLLSPDSRVRFLHRDSTRVWITSVTSQQITTPNNEPMNSTFEIGETSITISAPTISTQEILQNVLTPESRTRLLHRNSTRMRRSNMTVQQRAAANIARRGKRHIHESTKIIDYRCNT